MTEDIETRDVFIGGSSGPPENLGMTLTLPVSLKEFAIPLKGLSIIYDPKDSSVPSARYRIKDGGRAEFVEII